MNVLVINCGSSSLKYQLINSDTEAVIAKGLCERIGIDGRLTYQPTGGEKSVQDLPMPTHTEAIQYVINALTDAETGVVASLEEIGAVGHRVVHGGEKFATSTVLTEEVINVIEECNDLDPLHNPAQENTQPHRQLQPRRHLPGSRPDDPDRPILRKGPGSPDLSLHHYLRARRHQRHGIHHLCRQRNHPTHRPAS